MASTSNLMQNPRRLGATLLAIAVVGAVAWQLFNQWQAGRVWETGRNAGHQLADQGRFGEAEAPLAESLEAARKLGPQDPRLDQALVDLADAREAQGKTEDVVYLRLQSLENRVTRFGAVSPQAAAALQDLADVYYTRKEYVSAEGIYNQAIDTWERLNAAEQMDAVPSYLGRARSLEKQGKFDKAQDDFAHALRVQEKALGNTSAALAPTIRSLVRVLRARGEEGSATALENRLTSLAVADPTATPAPEPTAPAAAAGSH